MGGYARHTPALETAPTFPGDSRVCNFLSCLSDPSRLLLRAGLLLRVGIAGIHRVERAGP